MKLWEYKHPYYCAEEGYYYNASQVSGWGAPHTYRTFQEFLNEWHDADLDMNMAFRWDWERLTPEEYKEERVEDLSSDQQNSAGNFSELKLFLMMQRKGCKKVITITHMEDSDNELVKMYLKPRWEHLKTLWAGISEQ